MTEYTACQEVILDIADQPFHLALGEGMTRFAQFRPKPDQFHESLVVVLPDRMPFRIAADDNTLHVIRKDTGRNAHEIKRMDHSDKQVFLPGIREELNVAQPTVMTYHGKTGRSV